jgi:hypothetical protein
MMVADPTQSFVRTMDILFVGTPVLAMSAVIPATLSLMFQAIPVTLMYVLFVVWTLGLCALHRVLR